jgi:plasmid stabilization system protein ParE
MDYQVNLSLSARADLHDIVRYISLDAPDRALQFGQFLVSRVKILAQFPELGRIVPEFGDNNIREIVVRSYRVIYRVDHVRGSVEVTRFWHGARGTPDIGATIPTTG